MAMLVKPLEEVPGHSARDPVSLPKTRSVLAALAKHEDNIFKRSLAARLEVLVANDLRESRPTLSLVPSPKPKEDRSLWQKESPALTAWLANANFPVGKLVCRLDVPNAKEIYGKRNLQSECERVSHNRPIHDSRPPDWCDYLEHRTEGWYGSRPPTVIQLIREAPRIARRLEESLVTVKQPKGFHWLTIRESEIKKVAANNPTILLAEELIVSTEDAPEDWCTFEAIRENERYVTKLMYLDSVTEQMAQATGLAKFFQDCKVPPEGIGLSTWSRKRKEAHELGLYLKFLQERTQGNWCQDDHINYLAYMERRKPSSPEVLEKYTHSSNKKYTAQEKYRIMSLEAERLKAGLISREKYIRTLKYLGIYYGSRDCVPVGSVNDLHTHTFDDVRREVDRAYAAKSIELAENLIDDLPWESEADAAFRDSVSSRIDLINYIEDCINRGVRSLIFPLTKYATDIVEKNIEKRFAESRSSTVPKSEFVYIPPTSEGYKHSVSGILVPDWK